MSEDAICKWAKWFSTVLTLLTLSACATSPVVRTISPFDNTETVSTRAAYFLDLNSPLRMELTWNQQMPEGHTLAVLSLASKIDISRDTVVHLSVDGVKHKFQLLNFSSDSRISSEQQIKWVSGLGIPSQPVNREVIQQTDTTIMYFYVPDKLLYDVSQAKNTIVVVTLGNNQRLESYANWIGWVCGAFYNEKVARGNGYSKVAERDKLPKTAAVNIAETRKKPAPTEAVIVRPSGTTGTRLYVSVKKANLRKNPSTSADVIKTLHKGEGVKVIKQHQEWLMVEFAEDNVGWCHKSVFGR